MIKSCVIGWPIEHSRSPIIHGYWLKKYDIAGSYERRPVEPNELVEFIRALSEAGYAGCNVTIPHKEAVFRLVRIADDTTRHVGAVNTVYVRDGLAYGTNTDGEGFTRNLLQSVPGYSIPGKRVMVLGAGGASLAIVNALLENHAADILVANRTFERSEQLRQRLGKRVLPIGWDEAADHLVECELLVNTTSLGMTSQPVLDLDLSRLSLDAVVSDIVYTPLRTPLLKVAVDRGNRVVEGLGMLLHQAVRGFALWYGVDPEVTPELYDIVARDIDPGYR